MADAEALERELRSAASEAGLDWLLQQVDLAISEGHPVARRKEGGETTISSAFGTKDVEITSAPFTPSERVELLVAAIRRSLVAAPRLAEEVEQLILRDNADALRFVPPSPEEDARPFPTRTDVVTAQEAAANLEAALIRVQQHLES
jgi:hypothetical protein